MIEDSIFDWKSALIPLSKVMQRYENQLIFEKQIRNKNRFIISF